MKGGIDRPPGRPNDLRATGCTSGTITVKLADDQVVVVQWEEIRKGVASAACTERSRRDAAKGDYFERL